MTTNHVGARSCAGDSGRKREQRPGGDIVDGRSGHGQRTDGSLQHPAFERIRASTGKAVIDIATPMNSANGR